MSTIAPPARIAWLVGAAVAAIIMGGCVTEVGEPDEGPEASEGVSPVPTAFTAPAPPASGQPKPASSQVPRAEGVTLSAGGLAGGHRPQYEPPPGPWHTVPVGTGTDP